MLEKFRPLLSVAAVEVVPLLHFIVKVVLAVAFDEPDALVLPRAAVRWRDAEPYVLLAGRGGGEAEE